LGRNSFVLWGLFEDGTSTLIDTFSIDYYSQRVITLAQSVERLQTDQRVLALTFDAGSTSNGSDSIISILRKQDLRATFFLTGLFIEKFPYVVADLINDGHELANHTYSHPHLTSWEQNRANNRLEYVDRNFIYSQLNKTDSILYANFKRHLKPLWRAPFGEYNDQILTWAAELGYRHIKWSNQCDTWDWVSDKESPFYRTPNEIYAHLINLLVNEKLNGAIILMHFGSNRENEFPFEMLTKLIRALKEENYKILTVSQLLAFNRQI
jgi:peptidoglycan/xylan/chitin deacetylase (PgdA/CDA1 family)